MITQNFELFVIMKDGYKCQHKPLLKIQEEVFLMNIKFSVTTLFEKRFCAVVISSLAAFMSLRCLISKE